LLTRAHPGEDLDPSAIPRPETHHAPLEGFTFDLNEHHDAIKFDSSPSSAQGEIQSHERVVGCTPVCIEKLEQPQLPSAVSSSSNAHQVAGGRFRPLPKLRGHPTQFDGLGTRSDQLALDLAFEQVATGARESSLALGNLRLPRRLIPERHGQRCTEKEAVCSPLTPQVYSLPTGLET
jgi:hypothetical protein